MSTPTIVKYFTCYVPSSAATAAWLQDLSMRERGEQIAAAFNPNVGVCAAGFGNYRSNTLELIEANMSFRYEDYERTCAEFLEVGERLGFPPGTRLTHTVLDRTNATFDHTDIKTW